MKDLFGRVRSIVGVCIRQLRKNMMLLFIVGVVLGGVVKVGVSEFVTMGYGDYLTEKQNGFDFVKMKQDVEKRQQEKQQDMNVQEIQEGAFHSSNSFRA
jgi:hypothetical protein